MVQPMLWSIRFEPRDPSQPRPTMYVVGETEGEAMKKAEPKIKKLEEGCVGASRVTIAPVDLGQVVFMDQEMTRRVRFSLPEDQQQYRLAVCLLPV